MHVRSYGDYKFARFASFGTPPPNWTAQGITIQWPNQNAFDDWYTGVTGSISSPGWTGAVGYLGGQLGTFASNVAQANNAAYGTSQANTALALLPQIQADVTAVCSAQTFGSGGRGAQGDATYIAAMNQLDEDIKKFNAQYAAAVKLDAAGGGSSTTAIPPSSGSVVAIPAGAPPSAIGLSSVPGGAPDDTLLYVGGGLAVLVLGFLLLHKKKPAPAPAPAAAA